MSRLASLLYPQLLAFPPSERAAALRRAREGPFDVVELVGIALGLVVATALTRYGAGSLSIAGRVIAAAGSLALAAALLAVLVGPFMVRRARRSLDREIAERAGR